MKGGEGRVGRWVCRGGRGGRHRRDVPRSACGFSSPPASPCISDSSICSSGFCLVLRVPATAGQRHLARMRPQVGPSGQQEPRGWVFGNIEEHRDDGRVPPVADWGPRSTRERPQAREALGESVLRRGAVPHFEVLRARMRSGLGFSTSVLFCFFSQRRQLSLHFFLSLSLVPLLPGLFASRATSSRRLIRQEGSRMRPREQSV